MDLPTLRLLAGYSQQRAAELAGVSVRTWRRWERREVRPPALAWRWLRLEAGHVPGWPRGWRARRDGVELPGGHVATLAEIEARHWVWQLVRDEIHSQARALYDQVLARWRDQPVRSRVSPLSRPEP